jgi:hypothetical protein
VRFTATGFLSFSFQQRLTATINLTGRAYLSVA